MVVRPNRSDPDLAFPSGLAAAQHRAVGEYGDPDAVALDDGRSAGFFRVAARPDHLLAHVAKHFYGVHERIRTPIHRVVAGQGNDIDTSRLPDTGQAWVETRMMPALLAGPVRELGICTSLGIGPLALPQPQIRLLQHRGDELDEPLRRLDNRTYVAACHQRYCVRAFFGHVSSVTLLIRGLTPSGAPDARLQQ